MREFGITLTAKLKHADLFAAAKKLGGQSALAKYLDVLPGEIGMWINMQSCPPLEPNRWRSAKWIAKLEKKLFDLTQKTLDELFPPELRNNKNFLEAKKEIEATKKIPVERLSHSNVARLLLPSPADVVEEKDFQECLVKELDGALETLTDREREIVRLHWGLENGTSCPLKEIGSIVNLSQVRVQQIESRAMRKIERRLNENNGPIIREYRT